jgi:hypothetical protein
MMQTKLAALVVMSIVCGLSAAQAAETSSGPEATELHTTAPNAGIVTSISPSPSSHAGSLGRNPAPDCDRPMPSTASVPARLSRLVRSSTTARGVQCPIPPVSDNMPSQESHP